MCGGHSSAAPEGVSRTIRTIGEIEPCKLEVKKQAPIRKFAAMKELVGMCFTQCLFNLSMYWICTN